MAEQKRISILVVVDEAHLPRIGEVAGQLRAAGMTVEQVLESAGTITGTADPARMADLARIGGVEHVEESRQVRIAPPESDVQ